MIPPELRPPICGARSRAPAYLWGLLFFVLLPLYCSLGAPPTGGEPEAAASALSLSQQHEGPGPTLSGPCQRPLPHPDDGPRRLALLVGIGDYAAPKIPDLVGPPRDARAMAALLTNPKGYGFPRENVCLLTEEAATRGAFLEASETFLEAGLRPGDIVVIYFAGHGTQLPDTNGDEPDTLDETLVFYDGELDGRGQLRDDDLYALLARLEARAGQVTLIIDSCTSASASRLFDGTLRARSIESERGGAILQDGTSAGGEGATGLLPPPLKGLISLSAASDGEVAWEVEGRGIFTQALESVLMGAGSPMTWAQVGRALPAAMPPGRNQRPYVQGDLNRFVFDSAHRAAALGWEVAELSPRLTLKGPPLPGWGEGAELEIFDGAASLDHTGRPPSKARVRIAEGAPGVARVDVVEGDAAGVKLGDRATLSVPGPGSQKIPIHLAGAGEEGDLGEPLTTALREAIARTPGAAHFSEEVPAGTGYTLRRTGEGQLSLLGPEGQLRGYLDPAAPGPALATTLHQLAIQAALLRTHGMGAGSSGLKIEVLPVTEGSECARGEWPVAPAAGVIGIPQCHRYKIAVSLVKGAAEDDPWLRDGALVGVLVLYSDGKSFGLPSDDAQIRLKPGERVVLPRGGSFRAQPPGGVVEHILAFATPLDQPIQWSALTLPSALYQPGQTSQSTSSSPGVVFRSLLPRGGELVMDSAPEQPGRATAPGAPLPAMDATGWLSALQSTMVFQAPSFSSGRNPLGGGSPVQAAGRELTVSDFDILPYVSGAPPATASLLVAADALIKAEVDFHSHDWSAPTVAENLSRGIDCSRFVWRAFLDAGLPYTPGDRYAHSALMAQPEGPMAAHFDRCDTEPLQTGDVLVYRDDARGAGHTVIVVDPEARIAAGSHGFDAGASTGRIPDRGAEYQRLKSGPDWDQWDLPSMRRVACWRHQRFAAPSPDPAPVMRHRACDASTCGR